MDIKPSSIDHLNHNVLNKNKTVQSESNKFERSDEQIINEMIQNEDTPASTQWKVLETVDEMSAAITLFNNRRAFDKKKVGKEGGFSSFDAILEDDAINKSHQILNTIKSGDASMEYLLLLSKQMFPDTSDLILALREMKKNIEELKEAERKRLQELLTIVENKSDKKTYKSGINCALKAKLFGKSFDLSPKLLRTTYREFLFSENEPIESYIRWISNYGISKREAVVDFIESSLLSDISSNDPSCSKIEFGLFLKKLSEIQKLKSVEHLFVSKIINDKELKEINNEERLVFFILSIIKDPQVIDIILKELLGGHLFYTNHKRLAKILCTIYIVIKKIPTELFRDIESYNYLMDYLRSIIGKNLKLEKLS